LFIPGVLVTTEKEVVVIGLFNDATHSFKAVLVSIADAKVGACSSCLDWLAGVIPCNKQCFCTRGELLAAKQWRVVYEKNNELYTVQNNA